MTGPAITQPTKQPMDRRPVSQEASWNVIRVVPPHTELEFVLRREGMAGPV